MRSQRAVFTNKLKPNAKDALNQGEIKDNITILAGGFGICGIPMTLISCIKEMGYKDLTFVSNDFGTTNWGLGILLDPNDLNKNQIKRVVGSYMAENTNVGSMYTSGNLELELMPQGTLAEKLRAGGSGIPAFYTPAGVHTIIESGEHVIKYDKSGYPLMTSKPKESRVFEGKKYILERCITGHIGLVRAWRADLFGNLQFRQTAENFNKPVAMASDFTIAEVEEIVPIGTLKENEIHVSGIYIQAIIQSEIDTKLHHTVYRRNGDDKDKINSKRIKKRTNS
jgi:acyl CoA:acetate/3-ketoacid CoA transferase alpha subunit